MNRRWNHMCRTSPNKNVHVRNDCEAFAHISLQGLLLLLQLLRSTFSFFFFFFFAPRLRICPPPNNVKNLKCPQPTSPALLRSDLAQAWEAGGWPGSLRGVYDLRRAAEGPCAVNLCIFENAGPAVLLMGPIQDAPRLPACLPEALGYCCSGIRSLLPHIPPEIPLLLMRDEAESANRKEKKHAMFGKWLQSDYSLPTFPTIAIAPEYSGVILWSVGNTMVRLTKSLLHHLAWVKCILFLWFLPFIVIPRSSF